METKSTASRVLLLIFGVILIILGFVLFATPGMDAVILGYIVCILMLVYGIAEIVFYCTHRKLHIASGWVLADGVQRTHPEGGNYTPPDLRNRFIVGVGADGGTYTPGTDGIGTGNYAPGATGGQDRHKLTVAELASHNHASVSGHLLISTGMTGVDGSAGTYGNTPTTANTGSDSAHENRPPYYALCFLYKI